MSHFVLTKTVLRQGVWHGVLTAKDGAEAPQITVSHQGAELAEVTLTAAKAAGEWHLSSFGQVVVSKPMHPLMLLENSVPLFCSSFYIRIRKFNFKNRWV